MERNAQDRSWRREVGNLSNALNEPLLTTSLQETELLFRYSLPPTQGTRNDR
jgi:hypothetical protein